MDTISWVFTGIGVVLLLVGIVFVQRNHAITTGQALVFAFGAALIALPHVKDFEWSDGKLKYTAKETTLDLANEVETLIQKQKAMAQQIATLSDALKSTSGQLAELQTSVKVATPSIELPAAIDGFAPSLWDNLKTTSKDIESSNNKSLQNLNVIQKDLMLSK